MEIRLVAKVLGGLLIVLGVIIGLPGFHALFTGNTSAIHFFLSAAIGITIGLILWLFNRSYTGEVNHRTGFPIVAFSWLAAGLLGALPYYFSGTFTSFVDAFFESASGFSGTGASVLTDIESSAPSILLWRSMTQWLGGMGIIVFFIAILPVLGVGGVQLFRAETTGPQKDRITPRVQDTAKTLWLLYLGFTVLLAVLLFFSGMSIFDAINHAMTTLSTGGFSTRNYGIRSFDSPTIDYLIAVFMMLGSVNFSLHYRAIVMRRWDAYRDNELKIYSILVILAVASTLTCLLRWDSTLTFEEGFRQSFFTIAGTISSTGFTNYDYLPWPQFTHFVLVLIMVMGGMSGSTAGGMKCIRLVVAFKLLLKELKQVVHPHGVLAVKVNGKTIKPNVSSAIWGFLFMYLFVFTVVMGYLMLADNLDLVSSSTATFSALSNIGPALGKLGPYDNYAFLSDGSKIVLTLAMVMGRLEFFTILVLFTPEYWKK